MIKKILIMFFILSSLGVAFAGNVVKTEYYPNGKQRLVAHYNEKGLLDGVSTEYYVSGNKHFTKNYYNGVLQGNAKYYYENGIEYRSEPYVDGKLEGKVLEYYSDGILRSEEVWKKGVQNGEQIVFFHNGRKELNVKTIYLDGKKQTETTYDENGDKVFEI